MQIEGGQHGCGQTQYPCAVSPKISHHAFKLVIPSFSPTFDRLPIVLSFRRHQIPLGDINFSSHPNDTISFQACHSFILLYLICIYLFPITSSFDDTTFPLLVLMILFLFTHPFDSVFRPFVEGCLLSATYMVLNGIYLCFRSYKTWPGFLNRREDGYGPSRCLVPCLKRKVHIKCTDLQFLHRFTSPLANHFKCSMVRYRTTGSRHPRNIENRG